MPELLATPEYAYYLAELFPAASEDLLRLLAAAAENANLAESDFQTIRDLLELAGYDGPESLHVLLLNLQLALEEGSLCVEATIPRLSRRLADLVGDTEAISWAERILADLDQVGFPNLIGLDARANRPVILHSSGSKRFLYFQKHLIHELIFQEVLSKRLAGTAEINPAARPFQDVLKEVLQECPLRVGGRPLVLDHSQKLALEMALARNFAVVSGGPGTGKTSIVLTLLRCLVRLGFAPERLALAAPTGRAAQRLGEAIRGGLAQLPNAEGSADSDLADLPAKTLHYLLRYNPELGTFGRHVENPIPADVVIVDEVSMVGLELLSHLLQALGTTTKLILLGDKDQLPSVDAGAVLANFVDRSGARTPEHQRVPVVILEENYRSQPHIQEVARAINRQDTGIVEQLPMIHLAKTAAGYCLTPSLAKLEKQGGCCFIPQSGANVAELRHVLQEFAKQQYLKAGADLPGYLDLVRQVGKLPMAEDLPAEQKESIDQLFRVLGRARILTLVREGRWGCVDINHFLDQQLRQRGDRTGRTLFPGAPVLITRNDHQRQLFNGDVGITLATDGGGLRVIFQRSDGFASFAAEALPAHELGFALTIHKSQGSEYGQVLLILPPEGGRPLLTKEILYTGITRARQLAVIHADREVLIHAITRKIDRETGWQAQDTD